MSTQTQHTPGPWRVHQFTERGKHGTIWTDISYTVVVQDTTESQPKWVCKLYGESAANANLIAAAPELLEALEACQKYIDFNAKHYATPTALELQQKVITTIAKARGGQS